MSEENTRTTLPEHAEWRGVKFKFKLRWHQSVVPSEPSAHFYAESESSLYPNITGIYQPDDKEWAWWISGSLGAGGKTFHEAMEAWHVGRLKAGDEARLIEESTCAPTKRTGEE